MLDKDDNVIEIDDDDEAESIQPTGVKKAKADKSADRVNMQSFAKSAEAQLTRANALELQAHMALFTAPTGEMDELAKSFFQQSKENVLKKLASRKSKESKVPKPMPVHDPTHTIDNGETMGMIGTVVNL